MTYLGTHYSTPRIFDEADTGTIFVRWSREFGSVLPFTTIKEAVQFAYGHRHKWDTSFEMEIQLIKLYNEHCKQKEK